MWGPTEGMLKIVAWLQDYLTAPMPYLIGLPFPKDFKGLDAIELEDVVCVDLDSGTCCSGGLQGKQLDFALLPWSHHLKDAVQVGPGSLFP